MAYPFCGKIYKYHLSVLLYSNFLIKMCKKFKLGGWELTLEVLTRICLVDCCRD